LSSGSFAGTFLSRVFGWAPIEAAQLLSKARLDWQVSLSRTLLLWVQLRVDPEHLEADGRLILAWANLGALVEGTLKWFAAVFYDDYLKSTHAIRDKRGNIASPDGVQFDRLRQFFLKAEVWLPGEESYDAWILQVQTRRNAIHAFQHRELGSFEEFDHSVRRYHDLLADLDARVPYPEE
jgi:hypothetical protein